jgi:hypothetical protein
MANTTLMRNPFRFELLCDDAADRLDAPRDVLLPHRFIVLGPGLRRDVVAAAELLDQSLQARRLGITGRTTGAMWRLRCKWGTCSSVAVTTLRKIGR